MTGYSSVERHSESGAQQFHQVAALVTEHLTEILGTDNGELPMTRQTEYLVPPEADQVYTGKRLHPQADLKNSFIYSLLQGMIENEAVILREANLLGMDFAPPRAVLLIDAAGHILPPDTGRRRETSDTQVRRRAQDVIGEVVSFFHLPNDTICAYIGNGDVAVLKASDSQNLATWARDDDWAEHGDPSWMNLRALERAGEELLVHLRRSFGDTINIGIGRHHSGIRGLTRSYQDARAALSLGRRFCGSAGVYCLDRLGIAAFIGIPDEWTKFDLATFMLRPLDHEPELLQTLEVFFEQDCCASTTASKLSVHRNTLSYRLEKIATLIGLHPRKFDDAVQIRLAMMLRRCCAVTP